MLNLRYRTDYYNEFQHSKSYFKLDIRLNKTFWNKALTVNLYALDLLRTSKERLDTYGIGVNLTKDCYNYEIVIIFSPMATYYVIKHLHPLTNKAWL